MGADEALLRVEQGVSTYRQDHPRLGFENLTERDIVCGAVMLCGWSLYPKHLPMGARASALLDSVKLALIHFVEFRADRIAKAGLASFTQEGNFALAEFARAWNSWHQEVVLAKAQGADPRECALFNFYRGVCHPPGWFEYAGRVVESVRLKLRRWARGQRRYLIAGASSLSPKREQDHEEAHLEIVSMLTADRPEMARAIVRDDDGFRFDPDVVMSGLRKVENLAEAEHSLDAPPRGGEEGSETLAAQLADDRSLRGDLDAVQEIRGVLSRRVREVVDRLGKSKATRAIARNLEALVTGRRSHKEIAEESSCDPAQFSRKWAEVRELLRSDPELRRLFEDL